MEQKMKEENPTAKAGPADSRRAHILLVEDNADHAELIRCFFEERSGRMLLTRASNLEEARTLLLSAKPDLVLADFLLPDGRGIELLGESGPPDFPLVLMTSHGDEKLAFLAVKRGALGYVVKDENSLADLPDTVERVLGEWDEILRQRRNGRRLARLNECFLSFEVDPAANISKLTALCGELLGADHAVYCRSGDRAGVTSRWKASQCCGSIPEQGNSSLCQEVAKTGLMHSREILAAHSEVPWERSLAARGFNSCVGHPVLSQGQCIGCLCLFFSCPFRTDEDDGKLLGILCSAVGIEDARKRAEEAWIQSEERFRALTENTNEITVVLDDQGFVGYASQTIYRLYGWKREEVEGQRADLFVCADDMPLLAKAMKDLKEANCRSLKIPEIRVREKGKGLRRMEALFTDMRDNPAVQGIVVQCRDITERKVMEEQIIQSRKMDAIGQLAGGIAHDFNNQLTAILGYADLLRQELGDPELNSYAEKIMNSAKRGADLTSKLLAFARKGKQMSIPVDIHRIIEEIIGLLERLIDKKIRMQRRFSAFRPVVVGDPSQLQNALLNLGLNARDAMPEGGEMTFATEETSAGEGEALSAGPYVRVDVSDTGIGIDDSIRERIFEPFFTTKEVGKGTGMGLAAVYGIVINHGGDIQVVSRPGEGSTFRIRLPMVQALNAKKGESAAGLIRGNAQILVVDDERSIRRAVSSMLLSLGYRPHTCRDGAEAVGYYHAFGRQIDLVILDMIMPDMNGKETFFAMREIDPNVKAVIASGYSMENEAQAMLKAGVAGFLPKPFHLSELSKVLADILGRAK